MRDGVLKQDPVKTLAALKRKNVLPLSVPDNKATSVFKQGPLDYFSPSQDNHESPLKVSSVPLKKPISNLSQIDPESQPKRHNNLRIYEHLMQFNEVDLQENIDIEEKFRLR